MLRKNPKKTEPKRPQQRGGGWGVRAARGCAAEAACGEGWPQWARLPAEAACGEGKPAKRAGIRAHWGGAGVVRVGGCD